MTDKKNNTTKKKSEWEVIEDNFDYDEIIAKYADELGVDPDLIKSIINVESSFLEDAESSLGASGLMQLMKDAFIQTWGDEWESMWENRFDPEVNIYTGTKYYKWLLDGFDDDADEAYAAYHMGRQGLKDWLKEHNNDLDGNLDQLGPNTRRALERFRKAKEGMQKQRSGAFGECKWVTIDGRHVCIEEK